MDSYEKFKTGLADGIIGDNIETAEMLLKIGIDKVAETLLKIFDSVDKIKEFIISAGEHLLKEIQNLASLKPYDTGKSIG